MISVAVLSQKGGVGKTITVANLAPALAGLGLRVLLVDFDPQGDLTASFGIDGEARTGVHHVLSGAPGAGHDALVDVTPAGVRGSVVLLPTARGLRELTAPLLGGSGTELRDLIEPLADHADLVLIDTPAGETVFGAQAVVAAGWVLVTVLPGFNELRALHRVLDDIDRLAVHEDTTVALLGVLLVNAEGRWKTTQAYAEHLHADDIALFGTIVPRQQAVTDHARYGQPTSVLFPDGKVAHAYRQVAAQVVQRLAAHDPAPLPPALRPVAASS